MSEQWKQIPEFPHYDVSSHGRVRSYKLGGSHAQQVSNEPQRFLKGGRCSRNRQYHMVCLRNQNRQVSILVHKLVAEAFLGPCPEGQEVCHTDGDPANNHIDNLRYDTHRANMLDMIQADGFRPSTCKLTDEQAIELRILRFQGWYLCDLAARFGIGPTSIQDICTGKSYTQVGGPRVKSGARKPSHAKLTLELVRQLRRDRLAGQTLAALGKKYQVCESEVSRIVNNKRWVKT